MSVAVPFGALAIATVVVVGGALVERRRTFRAHVIARQVELGRPLTWAERWQLMD